MGTLTRHMKRADIAESSGGILANMAANDGIVIMLYIVVYCMYIHIDVVGIRVIFLICCRYAYENVPRRRAFIIVGGIKGTYRECQRTHCNGESFAEPVNEPRYICALASKSCFLLGSSHC